MRCWINTVSREHVTNGIAGDFTQADHGKNTRLERLERGDLIACCSPRTKMRGGDQLRACAAIGRIADNEPHQVEMTPDFHPWRRRVEFLEATEAPIVPLIDQLDFIQNKRQWGFPFRRGRFEVERPHLDRIAAAMDVNLAGTNDR